MFKFLAKFFGSHPFFFYTKSSLVSGFTLIELLVVIAIIAVLAVAVILTLNPAELLKQARDSTRISDLNVLKKAISLYLVDVASPKISNLVPSSHCGMSVATGTLNICGSRYASAWITSSSNNGVFATNGTGWIPVDFTSISSGAPIGNLPRDPTNIVGVPIGAAGAATSTSNLFYSYAASSTSLTFELNTKMESRKYTSGASNLENADGGNIPELYETGTNLSL